MPKEGMNQKKIEDWQKQHDAPYLFYVHFESIFRKESDENSIHDVCGYALWVISTPDQSQMEYKKYRGLDAGEHFLTSILGLKENF